MRHALRCSALHGSPTAREQPEGARTSVQRSSIQSEAQAITTFDSYLNWIMMMSCWGGMGEAKQAAVQGSWSPHCTAGSERMVSCEQTSEREREREPAIPASTSQHARARSQKTEGQKGCEHERRQVRTSDLCDPPSRLNHCTTLPSEMRERGKQRAVSYTHL